MNNYVETLDSLIKSKKERKKKRPLPEETRIFQEAWVNLAVNEGFSGKAEQFLYDGFAFCGAEPFYAFLLQSQDPNATLSAMFSGKLYGKDTAVTFRLVTHLLAMMLNDNTSQHILSPMIEHFPEACQNKDKKRLSTVEKTMEKYFFAVLSPDVSLCPLSDFATKPILINKFVSVVADIMAGIENSGNFEGAIAVNIAKVRRWISDCATTLSQSSETRTSDILSADAQPKTANVQENNKQPEVIEPVKSVVSAEVIPEDLGAYLADLLEKAGRAASAIRLESIKQKQRADAIDHCMEIEKEKLRQAQHQIAELQDIISSLRQKLSAAENETSVLRQAIVEKDTIIVEKDSEIAERIKMTEVLSRDRTKQADEALQRLASKIKVEYRDFQDAVDIPMNCDLGENLRLQLQSIFDILEKGGMKIRGELS